ncbi:MAG TPA: MFS transporter [Stellaceae bacterium]|nr:MFS transporter [Stellaceae bacterium]
MDGLPLGQRRAVMFCLLLGSVLSNLDAAIANIALPTIAHDLRASSAATVWVVNAYQLAVAISLLPIAALGEIIGLKKVYTFGIVVFTLGSLACAMSPNLSVLIAARALQGVGGASLAALGPALVRVSFPRRMIGGGLANLALAVAVSAAVGPTIAAFILSIATWPWLFLVNLPVGLLAIPLFLANAPHQPGDGRPLDMLGSALNAVALGLVVIGVAELGSSHKTLAVVEIVLGALGFLLLIRQQSGRPNPLLPLDLMRIPVFALSAVTSACSYAAQILAYVSLPFLFQTVMHKSAVETGLLVTPWPVLVAIAAPISGKLSARYPASALGSMGMVALTLGLVAMALLPDNPSTLDIAWRMALCGLGFGFFQTPNNMAMMTAGPVNRASAASGMLAFVRTIGWSVGSAAVALIFDAWGAAGSSICLAVGAGFAGFGVLTSLARAFGRKAS